MSTKQTTQETPAAANIEALQQRLEALELRVTENYGEHAGAVTTVEEHIQRLSDKIDALVEKLGAIKPRDRGPASTRDMTDDDARAVMYGHLANTKTKAAAETLGLSYAQVYSARGGYTFKHIAKEMEAIKAAAKADAAKA